MPGVSVNPVFGVCVVLGVGCLLRWTYKLHAQGLLTLRAGAKQKTGFDPMTLPSFPFWQSTASPLAAIRRYSRAEKGAETAAELLQLMCTLRVYQWRLGVFRLLCALYLLQLCALSSALRYCCWFYIFYSIWCVHLVAIYFILAAFLTLSDYYVTVDCSNCQRPTARIGAKSQLQTGVEQRHNPCERWLLSALRCVFTWKCCPRVTIAADSVRRTADADMAPRTEEPCGDRRAADRRTVSGAQQRLRGVTWLLGSTLLPMVLVVDFGAWFLLYPQLDSDGRRKMRNWWNVNFHVVNLLFLFCDFALSAHSPFSLVFANAMATVSGNTNDNSQETAQGPANDNGIEKRAAASVRCCCGCRPGLCSCFRGCRNALKSCASLAVVCLPIVYNFFVWVNVYCGGRYPYDFINPKYLSNTFFAIAVMIFHFCMIWFVYWLDAKYKTPLIRPVQDLFDALFSDDSHSAITIVIKSKTTDIEIVDMQRSGAKQMAEEMKVTEDTDFDSQLAAELGVVLEDAIAKSPSIHCSNL